MMWPRKLQSPSKANSHYMFRNAIYAGFWAKRGMDEREVGGEVGSMAMGCLRDLGQF